MKSLMLAQVCKPGSCIPPHGHASTLFTGGMKGGNVSTYSEKLKHPLWQRKRLEILDRDNFKCRGCGSETNTLNVHHLKYIRGNNPWEYPNSFLITLCDICHEIEHEGQQSSREYLIDSFICRGARADDLFSLSVAIDMSGSNDAQVTSNEWNCIAVILRESLKFRHAGGDLNSLIGLIGELCAQDEEGHSDAK